jgi:protein SCO1/2
VSEAHGQTWKAGSQAVSNSVPPELVGVDVVEHLGRRLPADAAFRDTEGRAVKLGNYFDGKRPTLLVFAYHTCPMLCSLVLDAAVRALNDVAWTVGREFDVVSISIDPRDTPETATRKRSQVVDRYTRASGFGTQTTNLGKTQTTNLGKTQTTNLGKTQTTNLGKTQTTNLGKTQTTDLAKGEAGGWHFLVGDEENVRKVTDAVGFKYSYDARQGQYAHPAAIYLLTPDGAVARYLYGIQFDPADVRLGLLEASEGRSISTTERLLLFCYHYDPQGKHYALVAMNVMRLGGAVTLAVLGGLLTFMWTRERRRNRRLLDQPSGPSLGRPNQTEEFTKGAISP